MVISNKYVVVEKLVEQVQEGFQTVQVQDNFVYKGKVKLLPDIPVYIGNHQVTIGDVVIWAKYSPDTQEIENDKYVAIVDLLACDIPEQI